MIKVRELGAAASIALIGAALGLVIILAIGVMAVFGLGWFQQSTANFRGETAKRNQVEANGALRVAAYDHFHDLCAAIQTDEASIVNLQDELKTADDPQRKLVLVASITALRNNRAEDINDYNADSAKSYTIGQFRSSDLPFRIEIKEEETTCTAS